MTRWRGGDGGGEAAAAAATRRSDDLEGARRAVESDRDPVSDRRVSADGWAAVDAAAPDPRWGPLRPTHRVSVEGRAARAWNRLDAPPPVPTLGRARPLGSDLAPAPAALRSGRRARLAVAIRGCIAPQSP